MKIDVITLFPKMFEGVMGESMMKRAIDKGVLKLDLHDMRQWAWNNYGAVDDRPYGGGVGMLIRVDVVEKALSAINAAKGSKKEKVIMASARGKRLTQEKVEELANMDRLSILCGHYEGFDERVNNLIDEEVSIGDYVLTGGELASMVIIDAVTRLQKGVLGKDESSSRESFSKIEINGRECRPIEYPQYTRPEEWRGIKVPEVLLSGDPKKISRWQNEKLEKSPGEE
jgi:tRNA (guanine37-N1)-methyltransferase